MAFSQLWRNRSINSWTYRWHHDTSFKRWLGESNMIMHIKFLDSVWHMISFQKILVESSSVLLGTLPCYPDPLLKKGMLPGYWKCSQQRASNCQQLRVHLSCRKLPHGACALPETVWIQRPRKGFKGLAIWALMWDILTSSSLYCLSLGQAYISELLPTSVPHLASSFHRYWPLHILHSKLHLSVCSWRTQSATFVHISQNHK